MALAQNFIFFYKSHEKHGNPKPLIYKIFVIVGDYPVSVLIWHTPVSNQNSYE